MPRVATLPVWADLAAPGAGCLGGGDESFDAQPGHDGDGRLILESVPPDVADAGLGTEVSHYRSSFFKSCQHYNLAIQRGAFLSGKSPHPYIESFNASLFLSADKQDVQAAIKAGLPAGMVLPTEAEDDETETELRVAFDFDGVIADDEAE